MTGRAERSRRDKVAFGDFQTPDDLVGEVVDLLVREGLEPAAILEPTCGAGSFLVGAGRAFPGARRLLGVELDPQHARRARGRLRSAGLTTRAEIELGDFFSVDWDAVLADLPSPLLVIGNPPWVTNAAQGAIGTGNLPRKSNFQGQRGIDALTGKSNFDVSEWMMAEMLRWLDHRPLDLAMLCKTAVARKILKQAWEKDLPVARAAIHEIDAGRHFGASVAACLFVLRSGRRRGARRCPVHAGIGDRRPGASIGYANGALLADAESYHAFARLDGESPLRWRSGIKHDCSKVMEFRLDDQGILVNGLGEKPKLEEAFLFPLLKSSDLANDRIESARRFMLVTQRKIGADTEQLARLAPRSWAYLLAHADRLDARRSSIYRGKPRFAVFGVGDYSFAPWKLAISGLYRDLRFRVLPPVAGRPVVLDDTAYFLPCRDEKEAVLLARMLESEAAQRFLRSLIFWDAKRPITIELLRRLDLAALAEEIGESKAFARLMRDHPWAGENLRQGELFAGR
ncbi:MAG: SAM-dependent DNA methyltransferase [Planctomycetes bacterium]|nr:SAM-dependent DNA methyltransferase [Planctomycetota bacterium]